MTSVVTAQFGNRSRQARARTPALQPAGRPALHPRASYIPNAGTTFPSLPNYAVTVLADCAGKAASTAAKGNPRRFHSS
jgi:hypothetical protein